MVDTIGARTFRAPLFVYAGERIQRPIAASDRRQFSDRRALTDRRSGVDRRGHPDRRRAVLLFDVERRVNGGRRVLADRRLALRRSLAVRRVIPDRRHKLAPSPPR